MKNSFLSVVILATFVLIAFSNLQPIIQPVEGQVITQAMASAFDAAVQEVIVDKEFEAAYSNLMFFPVPVLCDKKVATWPSKNPFGTKIRLCLELGTQFPWLDIKKKVGEFIIKKINAKYGTTYPAEFTQYNTSALGYFNTLRKLVDDGTCDIITSNATPLPDRTAVAHFQCSYGTGSNGFLRSGLNSSIVITNIAQFNSPDFIIGAYEGTTYSTYVKANLPLAKFVPFTSAASSYQSVIDQTVHAIVGDAIQYRNWISSSNNNATCGGKCSVSLFGDSYGFATFVAQNQTTSGAVTASSLNSSLSVMFFCLMMMIGSFLFF